MAERGRIVHQHVLVLQRFWQKYVELLHEPYDIGEDWHQYKHRLQILLNYYENSEKIYLDLVA